MERVPSSLSTCGVEFDNLNNRRKEATYTHTQPPPSKSHDGVQDMVDVTLIFICFVRVIKVVAVLTLLLYGAALGMLARNSIDSEVLDNQGKSFAVLAYIGFMVFVIALIIAEFGFKWFERGVYILHFWAGRGLLLGWIGIQSSNHGNQMIAVVAGAQSKIDPETLRTISEVVGWTLISIGILYIAMSMMCLQKLTGGMSMEELDGGFSHASGEGNANDANVDAGRSWRDTASLSSLPVLSYSTMDDDDIKLLQNTATALGMTLRELRNRFSGANGAREAQRYFDERSARLLQASRAPPQPGARSTVNSGAPPVPIGLSGAQGALTSPAFSRYEPAAFGAASLSDGHFQRQAVMRHNAPGGYQNDDDLEARYYAACAGREV